MANAELRRGDNKLIDRPEMRGCEARLGECLGTLEATGATLIGRVKNKKSVPL